MSPHPLGPNAMRYYLKNPLVFIFFIFGVPCYGQSDDPSLLTLDRIFSNEFSSKSFGPVRWRDDGSYTVLEASMEDGRDIVQYDPETGIKKVLVPAQRLIIPGTSTPLTSYSFSENRNRLLTSINSTREVWGGNKADYWVMDIGLWTWIKIGGDVPSQSLRGVKFSPDGKMVCYMMDHNIYVQDLTSFKIYQLTDTGSKKRYAGDWGRGSNYYWSPDGRYIAFVETDISDVLTYYMINNTETLYPKIIEFPYVKVGQKRASSRVGIVELSSGEISWLDIPGLSSDDYLRVSDWAGNSEELLLQISNRTRDKVRVVLAETSTGNLKTILTESDDAWLENSFTWNEDKSRFIWLSERDGWKHAYVYTRAGEEIGQLTPGEFDVISISGIDDENGWLYYMASPDNPGQRYLYRTSLSPGGRQERITPASLNGTHSYQISPDMKWAVHNYSTFDTPPVYDFIRLADHSTVKVLEDNKELKEKLNIVRKNPTEFFRVDIGGGVEIDGYYIKPPDMDPSKKYPLLYYIYGEPAGQTVLDRWRSETQYLWHQMLAQQGYVIMSVDNRGTPAPRGRAWRKAIDGQLGILAAHDQAAATRKILETRPYIDPERIGIYGHSGGGQMSLNLIFRYPDLYSLAMPSSFVSNQRYYHPGYQERYMGLLEDNEDGYINGSPITWAHQLKGKLLIIHGTGDSNVHYQSFEALINELVSHKKRFTMMSYPNRNHGLREGKNTQYHLYDLRTNFLMTNMPPGPSDIRATEDSRR